MLKFTSFIHQLTMSVWGPDSKVDKIPWETNAIKGFAGIGLIAFGLVLALVFQKKIGWIFAIAGGFLLLVLFNIIPISF
ncbi:MAG: hypothetical protein QME64_04505 [bacterium]|nr:hypothetical protein [bacterium]